MVRRDSGLVNVDRAVERWAEEHATTFTDDVLAGITHLGDTLTIIAVGVAISAYGLWRWRKPAIPPFVVSVVLGQILISNTIKVVIDRAWPELRPRADFMGTSFPSGHTTAAAATYLAVALVLGVGSSPKARRGRRCRRDRRRRWSYPGAPRRALVLRRARRTRDRLVVVRYLRGGLRRPAASLRGTGEGRAHATLPPAAC
jgi:hypothetical protein